LVILVLLFTFPNSHRIASQVESPEGTYYYHKKTRVSRWDKPARAVTEALNSRLQDSERSADSAFKVGRQPAARLNYLLSCYLAILLSCYLTVSLTLTYLLSALPTLLPMYQMRKEQMELEKLAAEEREAIVAHIKPVVLELLHTWREPAPGQRSGLAALINSLPSILPHLQDEVAAGRFVPFLRNDASSSEIKKAYFRAVRFLHPDKLPASLDLCDKMVSEHAFAYLCEVFQNYRELVAASESS
jgi:hypothetical protein